MFIFSTIKRCVQLYLIRIWANRDKAWSYDSSVSIDVMYIQERRVMNPCACHQMWQKQTAHMLDYDSHLHCCCHDMNCGVLSSVVQFTCSYLCIITWTWLVLHCVQIHVFLFKLCLWHILFCFSLLNSSNDNWVLTWCFVCFRHFIKWNNES